MTHPLIADFAIRRKVPLPEGGADRLTVIVDEKYRIHFYSLPNGSVAMCARLTHLPRPGNERDAFLQEVGKIAAGMLAENNPGCVVDQRETSLWLQQIIAQGEEVALDNAFGQFVNCLSFWTSVLERLR